MSINYSMFPGDKIIQELKGLSDDLASSHLLLKRI